MKILFGLLLYLAGLLTSRMLDPRNPIAAVAAVLLLIDVLVMVSIYAARCFS